MQKKRDWLFALPAVLFVAIMTQLPFILTILYSFLRWNLSRPDLGIQFAKWDNYLFFLKIDNWKEIPEFYTILMQTIVLTGTTLFFCTFFGFLISLLLDTQVPGINIARTLILGPFFVMSTATGVIWKTTILNTTFGWYGVIANFFAFPSVDLLSYYPLLTIILLFTWQWMPFFILVILAGLQGIPDDVLDSAKIDGAGWIRSTFQIKLPMIGNHVRVAVMLGLVFIVKEFGLILVTTAGGPGTRSYNLPFAVYKQVFSASNVGRASALATMTVIITLFVISSLYRSIKKRSTE